MPPVHPRFAQTPEPPYTAVIFTSQRAEADLDAGTGDYEATSKRMLELAEQQPGYLGIESVRDVDGFGITVSYWRNELSARSWKQVAEHKLAQQRGQREWYSDYQLHVATVSRSYQR